MLKLLGLDKIKYLGRKLDKKCFMIMELTGFTLDELNTLEKELGIINI